MTSRRRMGSESSETHSLILDIAERIMRGHGYAAVTSRRLAKEAGLSPQIVYYYFKTMDEIFEAVFARIARFYMAELETAAEKVDPLAAIWELNSSHARAVIETEILALTNHRKDLRAKVADFGAAYSARESEIIARELQRREIDSIQLPPAVMASIFENLARGFAMGEGFAIGNHLEARAFIEQSLRALARTPTA